VPPPLRPGLTALRGYHSPQIPVDVRLNTNESPLPPPPVFVDELADAVRRLPLHRYPDREATELRRAIAQRHGVGADGVFAANGSNEVLQTLLLAFGGHTRRALVFTPTYTMHAQIAQMTETAVVTEARNAAFGVDAATVGDAVARHEPDVVFFCSPNNPTGALEDRDAVTAALARPDTLVVVDEAYGEFADASVVDLVAAHDNLAVTRTLSKAWSVPALRLGYLLAQPSLVELLGAAHLPYHLNAVSQVAGALALRHEVELADRVAWLCDERDRVTAFLEALDGVTVWPSAANFLLFRPDCADPAAVWEALVDAGVLVRDFSARPDTPGCLRVTIGTASENDRFCEALRSACADPVG
jgi:histidinol-phosphate aminotransferase